MKIFTRILLAGVVALAPRVVADVKLPAIFSDHMVASRDPGAGLGLGGGR